MRFLIAHNFRHFSPFSKGSSCRVHVTLLLTSVSEPPSAANTLPRYSNIFTVGIDQSPNFMVSSWCVHIYITIAGVSSHFRLHTSVFKNWRKSPRALPILQHRRIQGGDCVSTCHPPRPLDRSIGTGVP